MNYLNHVFVLAQTAQERTLTILYVSLFVLAMGLLVLDTLVMKKWTPKAIKGLLFIILIISFIAVILLFISASRK